MHRNKWMKIEIGLIVLLMGISFAIAVFGISYVNSNTVLEYNLRYLRESTKHHTESIVDAINAKLRFVENMSSMIACEKVIGKENLQEALNTVENNTYFDELYTLDAEGVRWYPDGSCQKTDYDLVFSNGMRGNSGIEHGLCQTNGQNRYYFSCYAPIWENGKTIGLLVGQNFYSNFDDLHNVSFDNEGISNFLITTEGDILLQKNGWANGGNLLQNLQGKMEQETYTRLVRALQHNAEGDFVYVDENGKGILCISSMNDQNLFVAQMYSSAALREMVEDSNHIFYVVASVMFVCILLSGLLAGHLVMAKRNRKEALLNVALDALGEVFPRIARISLETDECVFVKDNEKVVEEVFRKYEWSGFRDKLLQTVHQEDREMVKSFVSTENMRRIWESGKESETCVYRREYKEEIQWLETVILPIRGHKGEKQVLMYAKNVDDSVKATELHKIQLWDALQQAKKAEAERTVILNYMSKDIQAPMHMITGLSGLAEKAIENGEKEAALKYLKRMENSGKYVAMIMSDISQLSIAGERRVNSRSDVISVDSILEDCREAFEMLQKEYIASEGKDKKLTLTVQKEPGVRSNYLGDEARLMQILSVMLSNAFKFSPEGCEVVLRVQAEAVSKTKDRLEVEVEDNGCGMQASYLPTVYDAFSKGNQISGELDSGVGLGLYFAKLAVESMHGQLLVSSEVGEGSKFTVVLELEHVDKDTCDEAPAIRVLAVDDNKMNLEIVTDVLVTNGYEVVVCNNGEEALLEFLRSKPGTYHVLLTDIKMPNMDGYALTKNVRESNHPDAKHIVIVAISAYCDEETKERAKPSGIDGFIEKPFKVEEFQQIINNAQRK